jgi:osmoprotectant transport system permease protein
VNAGSLHRWRGPAIVALAAVAYGVIVSQQGWWVAALTRLFPTTTGPVFPTATMADLVLRHLAIVGISSAVTIAIGIPLGVWVTRVSGRDFRDLVAAGVDFGQTFPPVAVLALMMPILGFGIAPAVVALSLYGLFPVVSNTVAGLDAVPPAVLDAARGMGMGKWRILFTVELPLAARVIMAGVRTSVIINIGTATVAAATGAGGLGDPIFAGINIQNIGYVFQGAVGAALLAVLADAVLAQVEVLVTPPGEAA